MGIEVIVEKAKMRDWSRDRRRQGLRIGFVPTMGYLHEGHLSLVHHAKELCDVVVASIYVNPSQFSVTEDFGVYPSDREGDLRKLEEAGCSAAFCPETLYHQVGDEGRDTGASDTANLAGRGEDEHVRGSHETWVTVSRLQRGLCGQSRPHFFRGVATIVAKLFHLVDPDVAVFGKKDYQQLCVIKRMVRDLDFAVEVVGLPTQREPDGLAMSSRNARLTADDRKKAVAISAALQGATERIIEGAAPADVVAEAAGAISASGGDVDYVVAVDGDELDEIQATRPGQHVLVAAAAKYGGVRLIDNMDCWVRS